MDYIGVALALARLLEAGGLEGEPVETRLVHNGTPIELPAQAVFVASVGGEKYAVSVTNMAEVGLS